MHFFHFVVFVFSSSGLKFFHCRGMHFTFILVMYADMQDGQYLRPSDPAYEQVLDSLAMIARHTPVPLLEALLKWRERYAAIMTLPVLPCYD